MAEANALDSLDAFLASCPEMFFVAGLDGGLLHRSEVLRTAMHPAFKEGASLLALAHPDDRGAVEAALARLRGSPAPEQIEVRLLKGDDIYAPFLCRARRSRDGATIHVHLEERGGGEMSAPAPPTLKEQLLDSIAEHMGVILWAIDRDGVFLHHDGAGLERVGLRRGELLGQNVFELYAGHESVAEVRRALDGEVRRVTTTMQGVVMDVWMVPIRGDGSSARMLSFTLDVTERVKAEEELRARLHQIENQHEVIRDLSTPIIEVWDGILTLPMVGVVDSVRTAEVMDALLSRIVECQARYAILDLTGVEVVDTKVASHLIELVTAIGLLGAEGIVAGIKPNVAQTMVALGMDLSQVVTQRNLRAALAFCLKRMKTGSAGGRPHESQAVASRPMK